MPTNHTVVQGEYLSQIAARYGFSSYAPIWNHGANAQLRSLRDNPEVLLPGDIIVIPDRDTRTESGATDRKHVFRHLGSPLKLRLAVHDVNNRPVANKPCQLMVDGTVYELTTNGSGIVEKEIPRTATGGRLVLRDPSVPIDIDVPLLLGHLDPVSEPSGQIARLENLGYSTGGGPADPRFRRAVEEFQRDNGLTVDGICGPQTQSKLKQVHGS